MEEQKEKFKGKISRLEKDNMKLEAENLELMTRLKRNNLVKKETKLKFNCSVNMKLLEKYFNSLNNNHNHSC